MGIELGKRDLRLLIAIEGLDGSGKTTVANRLGSRLPQELKGVEVVVTSEPTHGPIGSLIREYLATGAMWGRHVEALLFAADRLWHVENIIRPALNRGCAVILDRYFFSSVAYQAETADEERWIFELNKFVPTPDLAVFLDVPPEECLRRLKRTGRKLTSKERLNALTPVYRRYLNLVSRGMLNRVDGLKPVDTITDEIVGMIKALI